MSEAEQGAFAKYRPIAELGAGGMAEVFLAVASGPVGFNKLVVIKQIREQLADDPDFLAMFLDEARLAARLNHPNVVQTNEVGGDGRRYFICMEFLEGQPLNRALNRVGVTGGFSLGMQMRALTDALAGLDYAHELKDFDGRPLQVVHRDFTPHNIFVTYAGQVKVVDFGIAKALSSSSETRTGVLKGKVAYMAPEQAMGERVDRRADVFSAGMIMWEMLVGRRVFKGVPDVAALQKIVSNQIPSPLTVKADIPPELVAICMKALEHDRDKRYATAAEMAAELEAAIGELNLKGSLREAGKILDNHFADERQKIKQLVEAYASEHADATFSSGSAPKPRPRLFNEHTTDSLPGGRESTAGGSGPHTGTGSGSLRLTRPSSPSAPASSSQPSTTSTSAGLIAAAAPAPAPASGGKMRLFAAVGAALVGAVVTVVVLGSRGGSQAAPPPPTATAAVTATATGATGVSLSIESTPAGATVSEGGRVLGKTPLTLPLDTPDARKLVVSLDGFLPYAFEQAPAQQNVRIVVPLAPAGATPAVATQTAEASTKPKSVPAPVRVAPPPPPPTQKPAAPPLDINMAR